MRSALVRTWWRERPGTLARLLTPLAALYGALAARAARVRPVWSAPCPVVVVGNLVVGGAGKTPTVIALVDALRDAGHAPGVVSRGYGRRTRGVLAVTPQRPAVEVGDEPWLIARATGAPVTVGEDRVAAARALLADHPEVDLIVADDGLQHAALRRDVEVWVFDERGAGNGLLLPAGPLRQPMPGEPPPRALVLYNAAGPSTPLPGWQVRRRLAGAVPLADWSRGVPMDAGALRALAGRPLTAVAGIAAPERFFDMLRQCGLTLQSTLALPDHAALSAPPWQAGTPDVVCTEKDATKLQALDAGSTRVWVVGLDFELPADFLRVLRERIAASRTR